MPLSPPRDPDLDRWRALVRERLPHLPVPEARLHEIEDELAQWLRDAADNAGIAPGAPDFESWLQGEIPAWEDLARRLVESERPILGRALGRQRLERARGRMSVGIWSDLRFGLRSLRKSPGFAAVAVVTLTLGIGMNAAVFSLLNRFLLKPLPVAEEERLVRVFSHKPGGFFDHMMVSYPDYRDLAASIRSFESIGGFAMTFLSLEGEDRAELVFGEMATGTLFPVLGLRPARGRLLGPDDDRPGAARVVVLSYNSWRKRFGGADDIVGRTVRVNGEPMTVVGIAPQHFSSVLRGFETEVWVPVHSAFELGITPSQNDGYFQAGETLADARGRNWLWPVGRLAEGASYEQAAAEIAALGTALAADFPDTHERQSLRSLPMSDVKMVPTVDAGIATASAVLLAVVALVLLIACANLANLLLARALSRHREMATRLSLGASAGSLVRQLLIESLLLAGAGAGGGLAVAWLATKVVNRIELPMIVPISVTTTLDARVLVFTVALAAATALFFGLAPALQAGRTDIATLLREDSARGGTARRRRLQAALVTAQVALSVVLLAFGGLSLRSAWNTQDVDLGFEPAGAAAMILSPDLQGYTETEIEQFYKRLKQALASQPGVVSTTASSQIPLSMFINTTTAVADGSSLDYEDWPSVDNARVDEDYFETLDTAIIAGRDFDAADCRDQRRVAIVNTTLADRFWPGEDPLGMLVRTRPDRDPYTVVGVAEDGKYRTLGESPRPFLFLPISDRYDVRAVVARFASPGQANPKVLADAVRSIDDSLAISSLGTVTDVIGTMYFLPRAGALIFGIMGALGLGLAAMGLYGVLAYAVGQRTHEIGVRVAMGARSTDIVRLVTRQGLVLTAIGALLGLAGAIASTRALSAILYGVGPTDLVTFAAVVVVLLAIAALAAWIPARRATRLDPLEALRYE